MWGRAGERACACIGGCVCVRVYIEESIREIYKEKREIYILLYFYYLYGYYLYSLCIYGYCSRRCMYCVCACACARREMTMLNYDENAL